MQNTHCRVCGLDQLVPPRDERDVPSWSVCECCGSEAGYEDQSLEIIRNRRKGWLDNGAIWFHPKSKPDDWDLDAQLQNIPEEFR